MDVPFQREDSPQQTYITLFIICRSFYSTNKGHLIPLGSELKP